MIPVVVGRISITGSEAGVARIAIAPFFRMCNAVHAIAIRATQRTRDHLAPVPVSIVAVG